MLVRRLVAVLALPLAFGATDAAAQRAMPLRNILAPHRAVYDITLARTEQGSGVSSAKGRMVFEVTGSACDGYKMRQRMVVNIGDEDGNTGLLDFRVTTFESGDGTVYNFDSETTMNHAVVEAVEGEARRKGTTIEVALKQPSEKTVTLDGNLLFPSQHLQGIIDAALANRNFFGAEIYEGDGTGELGDSASAAIGKALPQSNDTPLRSGLHWPVSVGYFDPSGTGNETLGEDLPTYEMSFTLYENGVTNDLVMDYGSYALAGEIKSIEPLASPDCPSH